MHDCYYELHSAVRTIRKSPAFTATATLTLALGIGAATIIFSAVYGILIAPSPYKDADRIVNVYIHDTARPNDNGRSGFSMPELMDYREQNHAFEDIVGFGYIDVLYTAKNETQLLPGGLVTVNMLDFLGVPPLLGRPFAQADVRPDAPPIFALSYRAWTEHFGRDPVVLGQTLILNNVPRTLVAIMPPRYLPGNADVWIPVAFTRADVHRMVMRSGFLLVSGGAVLGMLASVALARMLASQVWGVSTSDPITFVLALAVATVAGLVACLIPARTAVRVNPLVALRND